MAWRFKSSPGHHSLKEKNRDRNSGLFFRLKSTSYIHLHLYSFYSKGQFHIELITNMLYLLYKVFCREGIMCSIVGIKRGDDYIVARNFDWKDSKNIRKINVEHSSGSFSYINQFEDIEWAYDGQNNYGLFCGMTAIDIESKDTVDSEEVDSLRAIFNILRDCKNADDALSYLKSINIDYRLECDIPPIHYIIADKGGKAYLYESNDQISELSFDTGFIVTNYTFSDLNYKSCVRYMCAENMINSSRCIEDIMEAVSQKGKGSNDIATLYTGMYNLTKNEYNYIEKNCIIK